MQASALPSQAGAVSGLRSVIRRYRSAALMAASRLAAVAAQFAVQAAVGALGGAAALGILQLFQSWTSIGGEVAARGLPTRAMRDSAVDFAGGDSAAVERRLKRFARLIARGWIASALAIGILMIGFRLVDVNSGETLALLYTLCAALIAAPLFALLRLSAETLKAMDAATPAILVESLVVPLILLGAAAALWLSGQPMSTVALLMSGMASYLAAPGVMTWLIRRRVAHSEDSQRPARQVKRIEANDGNLLWASSLLSVAFLHLPFLVLPFYAAAADIGVYAVANKLMGIITMLLLLLAAVFGPAFARSAASGGHDLLHLLRKSQLYSSTIYLPLAAVLVIAHPLLATLFSVPQQELQLMLLVLAGGHLVNAATGLSGVLLNMAGAARLELAATAGAFSIAVLASPFVGAAYGTVGLAVLFSLAIATKNLLSFGLARHYLRQQQQLRGTAHETA